LDTVTYTGKSVPKRATGFAATSRYNPLQNFRIPIQHILDRFVENIGVIVFCADLSSVCADLKTVCADLSAVCADLIADCADLTLAGDDLTYKHSAFSSQPGQVLGSALRVEPEV
jgi:hypothetical protein